MEKYKEDNLELASICGTNINKIENMTLDVNGLTLIGLRDVLIDLGRICREDIDKARYVTIIYGGFRKKNPTYVLTRLVREELIVCAYADEGIIKQGTVEGVFNEIKEKLGQYCRDDKS